MSLILQSNTDLDESGMSMEVAAWSYSEFVCLSLASYEDTLPSEIHLDYKQVKQLTDYLLEIIKYKEEGSLT